MKHLAVLLLALAALLVALAVSLKRGAAPAKPTAPAAALTVYCAAGLKQPVEAIAAKYRAEFGVEVQLQYGPTGALISNLRVAKRGDLFIAADDGSVADARKFELIREVLPLVRQHPVIAVRAGNPKNIHSLADLLRDDVKLALTNPDAASISRVTKAALAAARSDSGAGVSPATRNSTATETVAKAGETPAPLAAGTPAPLWDQLAARAAVMKPAVTEVAADLSLGTVDAAILWDATVPQFKGLVAVEVPELKNRMENASAAVLAFSTQATAALKFARYLAAPEKGGAVFQSHGFQLADGDQWAEKPELILYSGGVNRLAIEKLLKQFADREGVNVTTVFNGCGVLCATMKTMDSATSPRFPDAYYACDLCFVPPVAAQFPEAFLLTETEIGIAVRKGNPKNVKTLADLAQPGLKLGLCNAEQSTLGFMTRGMLKQTGLLESVRQNVVVEVPTADFLINQMRAGGLDAAIVYRVNAAPQSEHLEFFPIKHEGARAIQPFAVRERSPNRQLARRLLETLKANRSEFEAAGFQWRGNEPSLKSKDIKVPEYLLEK